jgi:hypothetical protein
MTAAQLAIDYHNGFLGTHTDRGVSEEAEKIRSQIADVYDNLLKSLSLGESYKDAILALYEIADRFIAPNWDGYGAAQVSLLAVLHALRLLRTLPSTPQTPDLSVDPDGEISFEWYIAPRRVFSISVGAHGELSYAGLFGRSDTHGTEYFGDELPKPIMDNLNRLFSHRY